MGPTGQAPSIFRCVDCCNCCDPKLVVDRTGSDSLASGRREHRRGVDRCTTGVPTESIMGLASNRTALNAG